MGQKFNPLTFAGFNTDSKRTDEEIAAIAFEVAAAPAFIEGQKALAADGQVAKTVLAVPYTTTGRVMGVSLGDGNVVEVYETGQDFSDGNVLYREFLSKGEPIVFSGLPTSGSIITSTEGFYGHCEVINGANETDMPLMSLALSFKDTFFYAFRNCQNFNTTPGTNNAGAIYVTNGPVSNVIKLTFGDGTTVVQGQENIELAPWESTILGTNGNVEYRLSGTAPMMAAISADELYLDGRLIMPLTNDGITWPRSGFVSAPYNNTQVDFWVRDGAEGRLNSTLGTGVSPNSPVDFDAAIGVGTGANDSDYFPNGATRVRATGLISAYSGADGAGFNATPLMPTQYMSQVVAQPIFVADSGGGNQSSVTIASPFEGTAKIYEWSDTTQSLDLAYTIPLTRNGVTVATQDDQLHPASGQLSNNISQSGVVELVGTLNPGIIVADVPITVVVQSNAATGTVRAQNGTTEAAVINDNDEMLVLGITPDVLRPDVREDVNGILRKRVINNDGSDTWVVV